jgi:hypothetical protein
MIFKHTWKKVLTGKKTQTRRLVNEGERLLTYDRLGFPHEVLEGGIRRERLKWQVGKSYAVQPGRGKKALGRIRLTGIRRERLQDILGEDARAELGWTNESQPYPCRDLTARQCFMELWDEIHQKRGNRWQDNPEVWVLEFEVVDLAARE